MIEQKIPIWTGDFVKRMHNSGLLKKDVATCMGYTPEYVGKVLSGKETPKDAETRFNAALDELIKEREGPS